MLKKISYNQIIAFSFLGVIFIGAVLLSLPISAQDRQWTPFLSSLFTATSATCVTGLTVVDTSAHWSRFGQVVVLCLIQIGGLGFMTLMLTFSTLVRKRLSLRNQLILRQSTGGSGNETMWSLLKQILLGTAMFEFIGFVLLTIRFCGMLPFGQALYFALFHSVSAFCNAGFDILGSLGSSSVGMFVFDPLVNLTLMFLIITGGLGFLVWEDVRNCRFKFKKMQLHTKLVLSTTAILLVFGWVSFLIVERNGVLSDMSLPQRMLVSMFQSVTTRTAGFASVDQAHLTEPGAIITTALMLIGGSPGSTAGGLKTTTFAVLVIATVCSARNDESTVVFKKRIDPAVVREATAIANIYLSVAIAGAVVICMLEPFSLIETLYETASAIGTVGLTMGITPYLGTASRIIIIIMMFAGRIGGLSFIVALAEKRKKVPLERPIGKILIG